MNKSIDILINKVKDIFQSLWKDCFFWLRKKPVEIDSTDTEEKEDIAPSFELPKPNPYKVPNYVHTNWVDPKEFEGFDNFPNKEHQTRKLSTEEFEKVLAEKRQALEDLLETNDRGEVLMGRDPETQQGFYMSKSEINHIKKVMYYSKKRK